MRDVPLVAHDGVESESELVGGGEKVWWPDLRLRVLASGKQNKPTKGRIVSIGTP